MPRIGAKGGENAGGNGDWGNSIIAWWHGWATNRLIVETAAQTQAYASTVIERMDTHWRDAWDRADQRADERHREVIEAIKALRA
jgi:hypothetical protein